jgi:hypothetical protein
MANSHPTSKFQKGNNRKPGQPNLMTRDIKPLLREAAANPGFLERVPVARTIGSLRLLFNNKINLK